MPITGTPQTIAQRWANNLGAASQKILAGVTAVTTSPTAQAANAANTWLARLNDPKTMQKFVANLNKVSLTQWQDAMKNKGIPRISQGAQAALQKFTNFMTAWIPYENTGIAQIKAMPNATLQDRIARAAAMITYNSQFPGY